MKTPLTDFSINGVGALFKESKKKAEQLFEESGNACEEAA